MAVISMFYVSTISSHHCAPRQHHLPHIHVRYQEQEAVLSIVDGEVLGGELRRNKLRLAQAWIEIHRDELMADWLLASQGEPVFTIDPLK